MKTFSLPDLGEGLVEAEIVAWHAHAGDHVVSGQPLVSVETEKAVVEIPSPQSGHIAAIRAEVGERVSIGAPLVDFDARGPDDSTPLVGEIPSARGNRPAPVRGSSGPAVKAAPAVRAEARRRGIDLESVTPSGVDGQIMPSDLDRFAPDGAGDGYETLTGARRSMAQAMVRAHREVVPATVTDTARVDHLAPDSDVTARLVRALVAGCRGEPALNASFDGARLARRLNTNVDVGFAVDTEAGLFVPVLHDVAKLDLTTLRRRLDELASAARARTIERGELTGATITLSNFGTIGGRYAALVVVPPQVAILGAGRIRPEVVADGTGTVISRILPLSLTFDHRAVTGGEAARFFAAVVEDLEKPQ